MSRHFLNENINVNIKDYSIIDSDRCVQYVTQISGGIEVKILEVLNWSQVSNQPSQLESATATRISRS